MATLHNAKNILELIRPHQFTKNLFVFLPAFFAFQITDAEVFTQTLLAFAAFTIVAGAVYIFNDWADRKEDAHHPEKSRRPIASGRISKQAAFGVMALLLLAGFLLAFSLSGSILIIMAVYFLMNIIYSVKLKHIPLIDITLIGIGFVLRLLVGAVASQVELSPWIIVLTFLLALFLSLAKRRDDVLLFSNTYPENTGSIYGYNIKFLDSAMVMTASVVVLAYILWTFSTVIADQLEGNHLYLTSVFVILGILRYMHITFVQEKSGNPSMVLLQDRFLQAVLFGWMLSLIGILYF